MSYKSYFDENKRDVSKRAIATKIIDMIDKIELNSTDLSARRWIWELIQNARDISSDKIDIAVEVSENSVKFSHNGKPFSTKHLLSLINQVSAKDRSNTDVIGKYGTGFITTALLSKVVEVESLIKEDDEPLKRFKITLDRTSNDLTKLSESLEKTMKQLDSIDESPEVEHKEGDISTTFTYILNTEEAREVAKIGYEDLINCIDYVLILQPKINKITLNGNDIYLKKLDDDLFAPINGSLYTISKNQSFNTYLKVDYLNTNIIVPLEIQNGKYIFKDMDKTIPKLFCEFPCVGTENFSFPVVLNNSNFFLTEPRDGVYLNNSQNKDVLNNKSILQDGVKILLSLIKYSASILENIEGIEKLFYLPDFQDYSWQNNTYIKTNVIQRLKDEGGSVKFINLDNKFYSLNEVCVLDFEDAEMRELCYELMDSCVKQEIIPPSQCPKYIPLKNCDFDIFKNLDYIIELLNKCTNTLELRNKLFKRNEDIVLDPIEFINKFLKLSSKDIDIWRKVITLPIFPTLKGEFKVLNEVWDLSKVDSTVRELFIKASLYANTKEYTVSKHPTPTAFLNMNLDTSLLDTKEYSTIQALNNLNGCKITLKSALILIGITPKEDHSLYQRHQKLKQIASTLGIVPPAREISKYSIEYLEICESKLISEALISKCSTIENKNLVLEYIYKYDLQKLLKEELHELALYNVKGGIVPLNKIPAKNCYYSLATKPELEELYFKFFPQEQGRFINTKYKFIQDLFQPMIVNNNSICNAISKRVLSILRSTEKLPKDEELLQDVYNYLQKNFKDLEMEFPLLKDKVFLLCSKDVLIQNQNIVEKIRSSAAALNMSVEEYLVQVQYRPHSSSLICMDQVNYFDDNISIITGSQEELECYNRAREIGAKGEKMAYNAIIDYYKQNGYTVISCSNNGNTTKLYRQNNNEENESVIVKLFADNQQGYDIIISIDDEVKYYIEVKSTVYNVKNVALSQRQLAKASVCYWNDEEYILICITDIESNPKFHVVKNPFAQLYTNKMTAKVSIELTNNSMHNKKDVHLLLDY